MVKLTINDKLVEVPEGTTILQAARQEGIKIPTLCYYEAIKPYGGCRLCVVEVTAGPRTNLTASCAYPVAEGIKVQTDTERVMKVRRLVIDLLWSRSPDLPILKSIALELGVKEPSFKLGDSQCILCDLCTRVCTELEHLGVIGMTGRGSKREVLSPFGELSEKCQSCGACGFVCPTSYIHEVVQIPAPCTLTCPAGVNAQGYVQLINQGKYQDAVQLVMEKLPLVGTLGRICPHPCEGECRRQIVDEPISICNLKRFAADQVDMKKVKIAVAESRPEKVAIIGGGPAGLSCAYHLARRGYKPTVFEALPKAGGMLRVGIPDYRLPKDVLDEEIDGILRLGVELKLNSAMGRDFTLESLFADGYKAVFLGVGCHVGMGLGIPGEDAEGVMQGVDFLRKYTLKEPFTLGKKVAVIGGGNVAIDVACSALRLGSKVTIVYRRSRDEMPAHPWEVEQALCEGVENIYLTAPLAIKTENGKVSALQCQRMELGEPDASGRRRPVPVAGSEFDIPVDMVIPAIGQRTDAPYLKDHGIEVSRKGTIVVDNVTHETSRKGVFAAGDSQTGPWIAIGAIAGGEEAAESIDRYLQGVDLREGRMEKRTRHHRPRSFPVGGVVAPRVAMPTLPPEYTCSCFDEIATGFTEEHAKAEAGRCLNCYSECLEHAASPATTPPGITVAKPRVLVPQGQRTAYENPADEAAVAAIINKYREERGNMLPVLLGINRTFNWLPRPALEHVADELKIPMAEILRVATFYNAFSLVPRGQYIVSVCLGTGCFVKGSPRLLERLERELKIKSGQTTEDMLFSLEPVRCIGCCALAPAVRINEDTYGRLTPDNIPKILKLYGEPLAAEGGKK
ncbi:MAG: FAD-dependent oxidoreductase [Syntrophobacterales bacterium]|jgi:NADPH-dependent glutamate synthase beta subunit-like oxidoreductase/NADH:ubiquinone oxidoreductase subunit E/ferredoxin|nr:FAD-dependent oxidoreductase [Syntrophobacterales bacterium]